MNVVLNGAASRKEIESYHLLKNRVVQNNVKSALYSQIKGYDLSLLQLENLTHVARLAVLSAFGHFLHNDEDKEDLLLSKTLLLLTLADGSEFFFN